MNRKVSNKWFINPGSVGLPVKKDLRASYALLSISQNKIEVTERKIHYDISKVVKALQGANLPGKLIKMIRSEYEIDLEKNITLSLTSIKATVTTHKDTLKAVRQLAREFHYEKQHSEHVTSLALNLFDELKPLHKLTNDDKFLLNYAALLHDIGWIEGQKGHHKTSMKLIIDSNIPAFTDYQKRMTALITRYHRKALPKDSHPLFSELSDRDKQKIRILSGILRIADGLDRTHASVVKNIKCDFSGDDILVRYRSSGPSDFEIEAAYKKSDLLKETFGKNIRFIVI
jgi:exopolyphosphatase/guanosine-5'-triphosphate,3'-diphosphate pyrophosphatase